MTCVRRVERAFPVSFSSDESVFGRGEVAGYVGGKHVLKGRKWGVLQERQCLQLVFFTFSRAGRVFLSSLHPETGSRIWGSELRVEGVRFRIRGLDWTDLQPEDGKSLLHPCILYKFRI